MGKLNGKAALVTGGSSGIGRACALALAGQGAAVAIGGRREDALAEVAATIRAEGGRALARAVDVRDERQMVELVNATVAQFGRLDVLVNSAGITYLGGVTDGTVAQWRELLETNVLGVLIGCREAARAMRANPAGAQPRGHIVNISSVVARQARPSVAVYSATKHAVNALSEALRQELRELGIRVTVVLPGDTLTNIGRTLPQEVLDSFARMLGLAPGSAGAGPGDYLPEDAAERFLRAHPGFLLAPDDVAQAVLFAVTQPASVRIDEVVVQPRRGSAVEN